MEEEKEGETADKKKREKWRRKDRKGQRKMRMINGERRDER